MDGKNLSTATASEQLRQCGRRGWAYDDEEMQKLCQKRDWTKDITSNLCWVRVRVIPYPYPNPTPTLGTVQLYDDVPATLTPAIRSVPTAWVNWPACCYPPTFAAHLGSQTACPLHVGLRHRPCARLHTVSWCACCACSAHTTATAGSALTSSTGFSSAVPGAGAGAGAGGATALTAMPWPFL